MGIDGRIIYKCISEIQDGSLWTGLIWPRLGTTSWQAILNMSVNLWVPYMWEISWLIEILIPSEELLCPMKLVNMIRKEKNIFLRPLRPWRWKHYVLLKQQRQLTQHHRRNESLFSVVLSPVMLTLNPNIIFLLTTSTVVSEPKLQ